VSRKNTTVIITTHYIEETRKSHIVRAIHNPRDIPLCALGLRRLVVSQIGLMRNGRLLTEKSPQTLKIEFRTNLIEEVFIKLCRMDASESLAHTQRKLLNEETDAAQVQETSFYSGARKILPSSVEETVIGLNYCTFEESCSNSQLTNEPQSTSKITVDIGHIKEQTVPKRFKERVIKRFRSIRALTVRNALSLFRNPM
jgi:ABC-type multidrug transport system ATPase subunit